MRFFVDYRERSVIHRLEFMHPELVNLPVGDYLLGFDNYGVLVERKTPCDFLASLKSNRLWDQMRRMLAPGVMGIPIKRRALIIDGEFSSILENSGFGWNHIMGSLMEITYKYGITVFQAENRDAFVEFFRILLKRELEGKNEGQIEAKWSKIPPQRMMSEREWKIYVLTSLPNVGNKLADALLQHFGSIQNIAKSSIIDLKKIPGIGDKKARQIYRIFH